MLDDIYHALDPVAFSVGPFAVRWYGIGYVLGFAVAALLLYKVSKRWKLRIDADSVLTIMVCVIIGIILASAGDICHQSRWDEFSRGSYRSARLRHCGGQDHEYPISDAS